MRTELEKKKMPILSSKIRSAAASFALAAAILCGVAFTAGQQTQSEPQAAYVCPPCGIHCDRQIHRQPGKCPVCGMELMDKADLLDVAILISPQMTLTEVAGPARALLGGQGFFIYTVAASSEPVVSNEMFEIKPQHSIADSPLPQVLVVPGGPWGIIEDEATMEWIARAGKQAEAVLGVGRGVVVLAKAGLLDGQQAALDERGKRFLDYAKLETKAEFVMDRPWVESGKFVTAVSPDSALDASLALIGKLMGASQARRAAQFVGRELPEGE